MQSPEPKNYYFASRVGEDADGFAMCYEPQTEEAFYIPNGYGGKSYKEVGQPRKPKQPLAMRKDDV